MTEARMTADGYGFTISADGDDLRLSCGCGWGVRWDSSVALIDVLDTALDHRCEASS